MEEKKRQIVGQALELFMERGFSSTSMDDVARAMNLGKATIYHYFESKESLFSVAVDLEIMNMEMEFQQDLRRCKTAREKLNRYVELLFDRIESRYDPMEKRVNLWQDLGQRYFEFINRFSRKEAEMLSAIFISGMASGEFRQTDPLKLSTMMTSYLWGIHFSVMHGNCFDGFPEQSTKALREKARFFTDVILNGINQQR